VSTCFAPLKLSNDELFGVSLKGAVGRAEKKRLEELAEKCLSKGKLKVVLDFNELESIGGGGAAVLSDFQQRLAERGGAMAFVGTGAVVRRFLEQRFSAQTLHIFSSAAEAEAWLLGKEAPPPAEASEAAAAAQDPAPEADTTPEDTAAEAEDPSIPAEEPAAEETTDSAAPAAGQGLESDSLLDHLLGGFVAAPERPKSAPAADQAGDSGADPAEPDKPDGAIRRADSPSVAPPPSGAGGAARHHFLSLEDAVAAIQAAPNAAALAEPIANLLSSHDLADRMTYCVRDGAVLTATDGSFSFDAEGALGSFLAGAVRPLSLLDIREDELDDDDTHLLAELQPDLILPVIWDQTLQAVAFLHSHRNEEDYGISENFALELLMRVLAEHGGDASGAGPGGDDSSGESAERAAELSEELERQLRQAQTLLSMDKLLAHVADEQQLWERLLKVMAPELDIHSLAYVSAGEGSSRSGICLGELEVDLPRLDLTRRKIRVYFEGLSRPTPIGDLPAVREFAREAWLDAGFAWVVALKDDHQLLGVVFLAMRSEAERPATDREFLASLLAQAVTGLRNLRSRQEASDWSLTMVQTLISLVEERHYGTRELTERMVRLLRALARELSFTADQERDLVYGALLRDIGMIPLGDLILHSPQTLTKEQWGILRAHPEEGLRMLAHLPLSETIRDVVHCHHERFNGEGYPRGLKGLDVPLAARLVAVVENYVAMVTDLPRRAALSHEEAIKILQDNLGERYDPEIVDLLMSVLNRESVLGPMESLMV